MEFIDHTLTWIRGEIFEARIIVLFGILIVISALLFGLTGTTPGAKAMLYPLLAVGILFCFTGGGMLYNNPKRATEFSELYKANPQMLIKSEKERVETFMKWYPVTRYIMVGLGIAGILLFLFCSTPIGRAIGISLIIIMLATFVIDQFSEERAEVYHHGIMESMK
jgi:hypothetical protein